MLTASDLEQRQETLREEQSAIDEQLTTLSRRREQVASELIELDSLIEEARSEAEPAGAAAETGTGRKRARVAGEPVSKALPVAPKTWRTLAEVQAHVAAQRQAGKLLPFGAPGRVPRVYVDGCFDMMHSGHMNAVRQAKLIADSVGGLLIVGVHTDAEIELNKGPPVMRDAERLALVSAVKWVDELVFDTPYSMSLPFLDSIDADYVVHGDDISINANGTDAYAEAKSAGRMKVVKRTEGVSTTDLVGRLLLLTRSHHTPALAPSAPVGEPADGIYTGANISSSGVSQFLATTWRLRQFSTGRVAGQGEVIVYIDGAFDLLHAGHVSALYAARNLGDFLVVGLHDDATVNAARGQNQPICSLHERALCVLALACVDEVILGAPPVVSADLIRSMNIQVVAGAAEQDVEAASDAIRPPKPDRFAVPRAMGILRPGEPRLPLRLADIVTRIIDNRTRYEARNAKREKKELKYITSEKTYIQEL